MARLPARRRLKRETAAAKMVRTPGRAWTLLASALLGAGCVDRDAAVVVYTSMDEEAAAWAGRAFGEARPEWHVRFVHLPDDRALARLAEERAAPRADVWWGASSWRLAEGAGQGLFAAAPPSWIETIPDEMKDAGGRWAGVLGDPLVLAFPTDRISRSRAPRDWLDLLHPRWSGELLIPEPGGSEALTALLAQHLWVARARYGDERQGLDWWARLDAWRKGYTPDAEEAVRRLRLGEGLLAIVPLSAAEAARQAGGVEYRVPESETAMLVRGAARVTGGPHPDGASAFLEWLGSPQARSGLAGVTGQLPLGGFAGAERPEWAGRVEAGLRAVTVPADSVAGRVDGWVTLWRDSVRGRAVTLF